MRRLLLVSLCLASEATAVASDLRAPFDVENTLVLPAGVRNPRFKNLFMTIDEKLSGEGLVQPLGNRLNKPVKWSDVIAAQDDDAAKNTVRGFLSANGIDQSGSAGRTTGVVNTYANVKIPVFAMGITDRLTAVVAVPITHIEVNADTGFIRSADGQKFVDQLASNDPVKAKEAEVKLNNAINKKLERLGYKPIEKMNVDHIGDVVTAVKYLALKTGNDELSVRGAVTIPTGQAPDADRALDVPTGDGQWDVGATVSWDHLFGRHLRSNIFAGYTVQLPDHIDKRLPESADETLSKDKERVSRDLGDIVTAGAGFSYLFDFGLNASCGYNIQHLAAAEYEGTKYDPSRYQLLGFDTAQRLQSVVGSLGFNGIDLYKRKVIPVPFQVNAVYSHPVEGFNVTTNDVVTVEVAMFF